MSDQLDPLSELKVDDLRLEFMSTREQFAAAAMQGLLANPSVNFQWPGLEALAVRRADALIKELAKEPSQ